MKRVAITLAVLLLVTAGVATYLYRAVHVPYAGFHGEVFVQIDRGTSTRQMAGLLESRGVVREEWLFLAIRTLRPSDVLQAGEYRFDRPDSAWNVFDRIAGGDVFYHLLTVPEGTNIFETAELMARLDWVGKEEAQEAVRDASPIRDLAPGAETLEGYLFPSTYYVTRDTSAREICQIMTRQFRKVWDGLRSPGNPHQTVTLASLVEKETGVGDERALVSGVFHNRLRKGIKLECDPTAIYAAILEGRYTGRIRRSDLASTNPYNTYQHAGLPPGPIASPGRAALEATLRPADTDYLFFVARPDGSGGHEFSKTLAEHNRAVRRYRRGIREASRKKPPPGASGDPSSGDGH